MRTPPAAAHRRVFRCREERGPLVLVFGLFPPVFLIVLHCFLPIAFFLAITMAYIVFSQTFAL
jgi:hypothetical protein